MILTLLVIAVDTLLELDEIPEDERTLAAAALRVGLRTLAQYFAYLVPAATFTAAFVTVAQGARAREIVALKAGGVNPLVALLPVFVAAMLAGLALALVQETAGVRAAGALAGRTGAMRGELTRSGAIWYNAGRVIYSARESDPEGERVADIHVLERDERRPPAAPDPRRARGAPVAPAVALRERRGAELRSRALPPRRPASSARPTSRSRSPPTARRACIPTSSRRSRSRRSATT